MRITTKLSLFLIFLLISACSTDEPVALEDRPLGVSARSFLSEESYTSLTVEVVYVTGFEPAVSSLNTVRAFLETYLNKPGGITIRTKAIPSPNMGSYSLNEIKNIEDEYRSFFTSGSMLTAFIFIADNTSDSSTTNEKILGKAYKSTSMVIFDKDIRGLAVTSRGAVSPEDIQQLTIKHEFGHLFGLVDNGTPAQSDHVYNDPEDPNEKGHCNVPDCIMARQLDYQNAGSVVLGEFCHTDLIANGGK